MNILRKYLVLVIIFALTNLAYGAGGLGKSKISKIAFQSNHIMIYGGEWNNPNSCQQINAVVLHKDDQNFEYAYTLLLAAFMAGKTVGGYSDGCVDWDGKTYNTIRGHKYLTVE